MYSLTDPLCWLPPQSTCVIEVSALGIYHHDTIYRRVWEAYPLLLRFYGICNHNYRHHILIVIFALSMELEKLWYISSIVIKGSISTFWLFRQQLTDKRQQQKFSESKTLLVNYLGLLAFHFNPNPDKKQSGVWIYRHPISWTAVHAKSNVVFDAHQNCSTVIWYDVPQWFIIPHPLIWVPHPYSLPRKAWQLPDSTFLHIKGFRVHVGRIIISVAIHH